jgi:hypothetical protein
MVKWRGKALLVQVLLLVNLNALVGRSAAKVVARLRSVAGIQVGAKGLLDRKGVPLSSLRRTRVLRSCCKAFFRSRKLRRKQRLFRALPLRVLVPA